MIIMRCSPLQVSFLNSRGQKPEVSAELNLHRPHYGSASNFPSILPSFQARRIRNGLVKDTNQDSPYSAGPLGCGAVRLACDNVVRSGGLRTGLVCVSSERRVKRTGARKSQVCGQARLA